MQIVRNKWWNFNPYKSVRTPEVYVPLQENFRLADITAMYVEQFNLFLHYKQEKYLRMLLEMTVLMYSSSLIAFYETNVDFLYVSTYDIWFPNKSDENNGFIV